MFKSYCQSRGNGSNEIPRTWQPKELAGFLVSRSLTLPSARPRAEGVIRRFVLRPKTKKKKVSKVSYRTVSKLAFINKSIGTLGLYKNSGALGKTPERQIGKDGPG